MKTLGIFADKWSASTGFAVVCSNLAHELSRWFRVIYFSRFGRDKEFDQTTDIHPHDTYETVNCQGGVWDRELLVRILKHYPEIDYVFTEDDWYSVEGFIHACSFWKKPFHFMTPIDSLPVDKRAFSQIFSNCDRVYIPNRSYMLFDGKNRSKRAVGSVADRAGPKVRCVYTPHGCRPEHFMKMKIQRPENFTFVWSGRDEPRKALGRFILAFEQVAKKTDAAAFIRTDWSTPSGILTRLYIEKKQLPIYMDQMKDCPHKEMVSVYNRGDVYVSTAKAGGCEMGVLEAQLCERPALVTDWTFMNENVKDTVTGFLIPVDGWQKSHYGSYWGNMAIEPLVEKMMWCYNNPLKVQRMGQLGRAWVTKTFNWTKGSMNIRDEILAHKEET